MRTLVRTRRRKLAAVAALALLVTGGAIAAFIVFTGVNGSGNGTFTGSTTNAALTVTGTSQPELAPGADGTMAIDIRNNDPDQLHTLNTLTGAFSSSPSECASHLSLVHGLAGTQIPAGATINRTVTITADATTPASCASGTWSVTFSGTTTP